MLYPGPSRTTLRQEVGRDRPCRTHGHGTGRARDRIAAAPAAEDGEEARRGRQGHHRAAIVGGVAGGPAVDPGGIGGDGAAADDARLVDREGERLPGKGGRDRPCRTHAHRTGRARGRIAAAPAGERGPSGGRRRQGHHRAAIEGGGAGGPAVDPGGIGGDGAAAGGSLGGWWGGGGGGGGGEQNRDEYGMT